MAFIAVLVVVVVTVLTVLLSNRRRMSPDRRRHEPGPSPADPGRPRDTAERTDTDRG
ncbi:hypothetical protein [Pseudonocardia sp. HH130630-07]|uniref:hypothetical protein n=1 Tax=Pseudonocardia sp. HH130630-07 TaxID=1690815 RepID=UPI0012EA5A95|nr:hypothetical protein [Pseudonocardia sp. HH130630-07]